MTVISMRLLTIPEAIVVYKDGEGEIPGRKDEGGGEDEEDYGVGMICRLLCS